MRRLVHVVKRPIDTVVRIAELTGVIGCLAAFFQPELKASEVEVGVKALGVCWIGQISLGSLFPSARRYVSIYDLCVPALTLILILEHVKL